MYVDVFTRARATRSTIHQWVQVDGGRNGTVTVDGPEAGTGMQTFPGEVVYMLVRLFDNLLLHDNCATAAKTTAACAMACGLERDYIFGFGVTSTGRLPPDD
jgi:hypothetical protein